MHIRLFLVDSSQLFRHGLRRLLDAQDCEVVGEASTLAAAPDAIAASGAVDMVVFDFLPEDDCAAAIAALRHASPDMRLVVLTANTGRTALAKAIGWAVDSYLLKDMSAEALGRSFQLVMLGQQIFPTKLIMAMQDEADTAQSELRSRSGLSPRELEILRALVDGKSNKAIARELGITEATVKVHLKALLRKVRVNNRTQAAIWALGQGIERVA